MSLTTIRRELKSVRIYFIPEGTVLPLGAAELPLTVSILNAFPDNTPPTNYTDWQFKQIETVKEAKTVKNEPFTIGSDYGGYDEDDEDMIVKRVWTVDTHLNNSIFKQLQYGLTAPPVVGVSQAIDRNKANSMEGVLLLEVLEKRLSTVIERISCWAKLRLISPGEAAAPTAKQEFSFTMKGHPSNTFVLVA